MKKYSQYQELKDMVLNDETTTNFVAEFLSVPHWVARCLVKDWKEQQEMIEELRSARYSEMSDIAKETFGID